MSIEILMLLEMQSQEENIDSIITTFCKNEYSTKTVLGIDIYKYSDYPLKQQTLIPYIFNAIQTYTIRSCITSESYIFQKYKIEDDFMKYFITTGDGGYHILNNPLEAFIFSVYFQAYLQKYNSGELFKNIKDFVGPIEIRYSITLDKIFSYYNNYYGPVLINNARILSKDKLNRYLIDEHVNNWFIKEFNSFENIQVLNIDNLKDNDIFSSYNDKNKNTILLSGHNMERVNSSKVGNIQAKNNIISVYNIFAQAIVESISNSDKKYKTYVVSIGNLNASGIE